MKKLFALLLSGILLTGLLAACGGDSGSTADAGAGADAGNTAADTDADDGEADADAGEASGEKALVYLFIKNRGDLSFWDSIAEGGDRAAVDFADRADIKVIETTDDLQANLTAIYEAADAGADLILTSSDFKDNLVEVANEFPEIAFVIMSENVVDRAPENMYGFDFRVSEASFLAGVAAADRAEQDGSDTIGFIGGMDETIVIQEFLVGFIQGAKYANPDIKVVYNYVGDWGDPDTARTQALAQFNDAGVSVIFACAGGSGNGVHTAASEVGKYVVGVDADQSLMYENDADIRDTFITSVLKLCGNGMYDTIDEFLTTGSLSYGEYHILGVAENAVGIVENDLYNELVSAEGKALVQQAAEDISSGAVTVWSALDEDQATIKAKIDELIG